MAEENKDIQVIQGDNLELISQNEIDMQIKTAKQFPRDTEYDMASVLRGKGHRQFRIYWRTDRRKRGRLELFPQQQSRYQIRRADGSTVLSQEHAEPASIRPVCLRGCGNVGKGRALTYLLCRLL